MGESEGGRVSGPTVSSVMGGVAQKAVATGVPGR